MGVEEQRVHAPGERLGAPVEEVVGRGLRHFTAVFVLDVLDVGSVLDLSVVDPGGADGDCRLTVEKCSRRTRESLTYCRGCRQSS